MVTSEQVLRCPMDKNDAEAEKVGDYFVALIHQLWADSGFFSAKRPFGNSGWEWDVYKALAKAGLVTGMIINEYDEIDEFPYEEEKKAERLVMKAIMDMGKVNWND